MKLKYCSFLLICAWLSVSAASKEPRPLMLTPDTKFVSLPEYATVGKYLLDGAWTVKSGQNYAFYNLEGQCIFGYEYTVQGNRWPQMRDGAVIMYAKGDTYDNPQQYILYRDGSVKELPAEWTAPATNFIDGVALIGRPAGFKKEFIYINTKGERVYGELTSKPMPFCGENYTVPPLKEGLRAWCDPSSSWGGKWGFIDAKGNLVIPARFDECRSFSEGYAAVKESGSVYFIDKQGNKAFEPQWSVSGIQSVSDVHDGIISVSGYSVMTYYNTKGEKIGEVEGGSSFYGGYAFYNVSSDYYAGTTWVMDKSLKQTGKTDAIYLEWNYNGHTPDFNDLGVATSSGKKVISPDGTVLIRHYGLNGRANDYEIEDFSNSGYAKAMLRHNGDKYYGFINLKGEFVIVFDWNREVKEISKDPDNPWDPVGPQPVIGDPKPPYPIFIDPVKDDPIGPINTSRQAYTVSVRAEPADGGSVSGGGQYYKDDKVKLVPVPNENWKFTGFKCETRGVKISDAGEFTIGGKDVSVVAMFVKKDIIEDVKSTGAFSAHQDISVNDGEYHLVYDAYMEMSAGKDIDTPYGKNTSGFLTCLIDGDKVMTVKQKVNGKQSTLSCKMFFVPMKISGIIKDGDKQYLVLDGGQMLVGGITLGKEDPMAALFIEMMMGHSTFGTVSKGRYRLELTAFDPATGECTFGDLERFHPQMGWILSDNYPATHKNRGFLSVNEDASISGGFFKGLHMKPSAKRDVQWAPPKSWDADGYETLVKDLLDQLGTLVTDWDRIFGK